MAEDFMLSIVIPHYNSPDLLEKLLSTIPDKREIQTIVVDDHSDFDVKKRIKEIHSLYNNSNFLFLDNNTSEHNPGVARNIGLNYAEGKWLLFADADDYFLPEFYDSIKGYFDSEYDIVFFAPTSRQLDTGELDARNLNYLDYVERYLKKPCMTTEVHLRYLWLPSWSKLIRNCLVQTNKLTFKSEKTSEDAMFSVQAGFYAKKITASKETIYCVTRSAGSITTKLDLDTFDKRVRESIERFWFLKTHLSKKEFRASEAYKFAITQLFLILRRKYGMQVFIKYFKIFRENKMILFNIRILSPFNIKRGLRKFFMERTIKKRYE